MTAIFFRGRNTDNIIADARAAGLIGADDQIMVVCRHDDPLAQPGDVTLRQFRTPTAGDILVVANGGTTAQSIPLVAHLVANATIADCESNEYLVRSDAQGARRDWTLQVIDLQRDGIVTLVDMPA